MAVGGVAQRTIDPIMNMRKRLWRGHFTKRFIPKYPCPRCHAGTLGLIKGSLQQAAPTYATAEIPDAVPERFVLLLQCSDQICGEIVSVAGNVQTVPEGNEDGGYEWFEYFEPSFMKPAPPIISIPFFVPDAVKREIELSFQLYWVDYRVCASRLRTSLERLMDHFGVPKTRLRKSDAPGKRGKRVPLDLSSRIDKLPKHGFSKILHALRGIGNIGAHGAPVTQAVMLDTYQLYEIALTDLFRDESQTADAIIRRLKAHKSK